MKCKCDKYIETDRIEGKEVASESDPVNHPSHYQANGLEVFTVIDSFSLDFNLGNVVKYVLRAGKKGSRKQDLQKAAVYLARAIERSSDG